MTLAQEDFENRLRILYSIDDFDDIGIVMSAPELTAFLADPPRFFNRASGEVKEALRTIIEARAWKCKTVLAAE